MYIDTHSHINFNNFKDDADKVIQNSLSEQTWMIVVGADYKTSKRALDYANKYEKGVYVAVGLHPMHIGHDAAHIKETQKKVFWEQLLLARRADLPVIVHCRQAHDDMIEILKEFKKEYRDLISVDKPWVVMHCFSGDEDLAWQYFSLGFIISFTGLITFSQQWDDLIRKLPSHKFMIETDCPFMTPEPHRGQKNEPIYVKYVAKRIAEIKNLSQENGDLTFLLI